MGFPNKFGVQDQGFVMPGSQEFPKMAYKKDANGTVVTKVIKDAKEEKALGKEWVTSPKEIHALLEAKAEEAPIAKGAVAKE